MKRLSTLTTASILVLSLAGTWADNVLTNEAPHKYFFIGSSNSIASQPLSDCIVKVSGFAEGHDQTNRMVEATNMVASFRDGWITLKYGSNWNGNMISTTRNYLSTNWVTISRTIPYIPNEQVNLLSPRVAALNQHGKVYSNVVADVEWKGTNITLTVESTEVFGLQRSVPE